MAHDPPMTSMTPTRALLRRTRPPWLIAVLVVSATILITALSPGAALADGDPGSDVLVYQSLFVTSTAGVSVAKQVELNGLLARAKQAGVPIRVAIIAHPSDLGAVGELWGKPRAYARFLGYELSLAYQQRLLVVMPRGLGVSWPKHSTQGDYRALAETRIAPSGDGLASAAETAVIALARSVGVTLHAKATTTTAPSHSPSGTGEPATSPGIRSTPGRGWAVIPGLIILAILIAVGTVTGALMLIRRGALRVMIRPLPLLSVGGVAVLAGLAAVLQLSGSSATGSLANNPAWIRARPSQAASPRTSRSATIRAPDLAKRVPRQGRVPGLQRLRMHHHLSADHDRDA